MCVVAGLDVWANVWYVTGWWNLSLDSLSRALFCFTISLCTLNIQFTSSFMFQWTTQCYVPLLARGNPGHEPLLKSVPRDNRCIWKNVPHEGHGAVWPRTRVALQSRSLRNRSIKKLRLHTHSLLCKEAKTLRLPQAQATEVLRNWSSDFSPMTPVS